MNMFEEATSLSGLMSMCSLSQSEMAKRLGVSQSYIANKLRLLTLTDEQRRLIIDGGLSERHARALLRLRDSNSRGYALSRIIERSMTVRESEALIDLMYTDELCAEPSLGVSRFDAVAKVKEQIKRSVEYLSSLGVSASVNTDGYGKWTYLTVAIEEG